jgi:glyoxylase-like metal-dependent hydrolase (beta-lactamase superfamily II)
MATAVCSSVRVVCHVLLLETNAGLVLVDTGIGLQDIAEPSRLGLNFLRLAAPRLDPKETAVNQVRARGFQLSDVRHIILTHLDRDHAGGLSDFPHAQIHVHLREHQAAVTRQLLVKPGRYISEQRKHGPNRRLYGEGGEDWFGFAGVRAIGDVNPDILIIPLHGHTPEHCGVALRQGEKW